MSSLPHAHESSQLEVTPTYKFDSIWTKPNETMDGILGSTYEKNLFPYTPMVPSITPTEIPQYGLMAFNQDDPYYSSVPDQHQRSLAHMSPSEGVGPANTHQTFQSPALASTYLPYTSDANHFSQTITGVGVAKYNQATQPSFHCFSNVLPWGGTTQIPVTGPVQDSTPDRGDVDPAFGRSGTTTLQCHWTGCTYRSRFSRDTSLWRHIKAKHLYRGTFVCPICGKQFDRPDSLQAHRRLNGHLDESS